METSVKPVMTRSEALVPTIAIRPIATGSSAATALRKTSTSTSRVSGRAITSALPRSLRLVSCTSVRIWVAPPMRTSSGPWVPR